MKSMRLPSGAIFIMTYFYRARGGRGAGMVLSPPAESATVRELLCNKISHSCNVADTNNEKNPSKGYTIPVNYFSVILFVVLQFPTLRS